MLDPLLSIDKVRAALGGKSRRTIYRWVEEGQAPSEAIGMARNETMKGLSNQ